MLHNTMPRDAPTCRPKELQHGNLIAASGRIMPLRLTGSTAGHERCRKMSAIRAVRPLVVAALVLVVLATPAVVLADGRVALVVGNSTYAHIGRLPNPDNDARDMSAALRRLGFEVTTELDADRVELTGALRAFTRQSAGADVSLVFYAGHGIEMDGVNYLVPVDARLERDVDVRFETVTVDDLLASTTGASLRLLILDACRNNPLARSMQRTTASRTVSGGSFADLNEDLLGDETLVRMRRRPVRRRRTGGGGTARTPAALLSHLETPLEIGLLFRRVRAAVLAATNGAQRPHEYHSLVGEHYLTRTLATGASVTVSAAVPADPAPADPPRPDPPEIAVTELHITALRELAEAGDAAAQTEIGERYEHGRGVGQDYVVALSWFRQAADQGHAPGQAALGFRYGTGRGVGRDSAEAVRWDRRAAEQGNARGQHNLGVMYRDGLGVARDYENAVQLDALTGAVDAQLADRRTAGRAWGGARARVRLGPRPLIGSPLASSARHLLVFDGPLTPHLAALAFDQLRPLRPLVGRGAGG